MTTPWPVRLHAPARRPAPESTLVSFLSPGAGWLLAAALERKLIKQPWGGNEWLKSRYSGHVLSLSCPCLSRMLYLLRFLLLSCWSLLPLAGRAQPTLTPAQWRQDLQATLDSLLQKDRSFRPAEAAAFRSRITALRDSVALKTTPELIVGLARAMALSGNAHTRLYLVRNRTALRRYPIRVWWFAEGLYIVKTTPAYAELLGAKVEQLAGHDPEKLHQWVTPLFAGSPTWARYMSTYSLTSPEILQGLRLLGQQDPLRVRVRMRGGGVRTVQLSPLPFAPTNQPTEAWWDLAPTHPGRGARWQSVLPADTTKLPLYLRRPQQGFWQQYLPTEQTLYVHYNRAGNLPGQPPVDSVGRQILRQLRTRPVRKVVVDLRFNTGGNLEVGQAFFEALGKATQQCGAQLYGLVGRATFSAGLYHLAQLRLAGATLVGEPAGDSLDYWAEGGNWVLPHSGLMLHYADRFHSYSAAPHPEVPPAQVWLDLAVPDLTPTVPVLLRAQDYLAGRDPLLERVLAP
ncbi:hypothetical protein [Hymenobacter sp. YC55]|uniref:hypothetical protein n=1 Tax=Hymenobacter sp. YC55 TaxID=3034019 RepID=UPI0023F9847A|nr:hypothetical protein [Hymenobacter sp. YC55]MDF7813914.1 hypothetical protein [Hymenobacter sp. YC55]